MKINVSLFISALCFIMLANLENFASDLIKWKSTVALESVDKASWARMVRLKNGDWLAGYAVFGNKNGSFIRIKRSQDNMRSWKQVVNVGEPGRQLDNANLLQLNNDDVLLAVRSLVAKQSYRVQVYRSTDNGDSFSLLSIIDSNEKPNGAENVGVWEPFLYQLTDGKVVALYANEKHSIENPSFSQVISQRVSADNGATWGAESFAVAVKGKARPGEPNIARLSNKRYALFYEVCGTENCAGHYSISPDGITWTGASGATIPDVFQNPQALSLADGLLIVTSNTAKVSVSRDYGATWAIDNAAFDASSWGAIYQTGATEIALVTGTASGSLLIRFGELKRLEVKNLN